MNVLSTRLLSQQLASPLFSDPADVVSHFGAIQAQEYRLMRWAVAMRTRKPSFKTFGEAYDSGRIVRLHLLRGTWQLVSGEDYWWMHELCAPKAEKVIRGWMSANGISLPEDEVLMVREILAATAGEKGSATKEDFDLALRERGIVMDDHRLSYHIRYSELSGTLCSGNLLPMKMSYSLAARKIGRAVPVEKDQALAILTRKYFRSHSPATLEDFVWWTGFGVSECRRGIAILGKELRTVKEGSREFYVHESCRLRGVRKGMSLLIPPYDEYLIGYKSRDISLPEAFRAKAHNNSGNFYPIIAHDGMICGNWSPFSKDLQCSYFLEGDLPMDEAERWAEYRRAQSR